MYCSYFSASAHYFSGNFVSAFHDISYYIEKDMPAEPGLKKILFSFIEPFV